MSSIIQVMSTTATTKTHGSTDGTLFDLVNPMSLPGDTTTAMLKSAVIGVGGYVLRGYLMTGKINFSNQNA